MPKLPYCPICIRQIEFLELYAIPHSFCANIQLFPCPSGSWLAVFLPALYCVYIACLFAYTIFAQVIEYETKVLKIDLSAKKTQLAIGCVLKISTSGRKDGPYSTSPSHDNMPSDTFTTSNPASCKIALASWERFPDWQITTYC